MGSPSPVLLVPIAVIRVREGSGLTEPRLQIPTSEDSGTLGIATQLPSPWPTSPYRVPALSEAILRSLVTFFIVPGWWLEAVVGCPSPVLLIHMEVSRTREGLPGIRLQRMAAVWV